jgi:tetraacyldisaccharide 4'-kinase
MRWRNRRFDRNPTSVQRVSVPVISVGNLTLGGTGKTPMVKWLARWLLAEGRRPAIVSRGYGASRGHSNDEARELRQALPDVPHVQNADRVAAAEVAIEYHGCDVILLDDGFQHRRLARNLDVVLLDALEPFGFDHVFPRGTLREPVDGLRRAHVICLSRVDAISDAARGEIQARASKLAASALWCEVRHAPSRLISANHRASSLRELQGRKIAAFCGIGNPAGFRHTLETLGASVVAWREFADHYSYHQDDISSLIDWAANSPADVVLCTHKDVVKIRAASLGKKPLWAVEIDIAFRVGGDALAATLSEKTNVPR